MTRRIVNKDIRKWSGIVLLLVCTPTTQSHTTYEWETNSSHVFSNRSPLNHVNLREITDKINIRSLPNLNDTDIMIEHQTHPRLGEKFVSVVQYSQPIFTDDPYIRPNLKLDVVSTEHPAEQEYAVKPFLNIGGRKHLSDSVTYLIDQDNENNKSARGTSTIIPIIESISKKSMNSHANATILNYQNVSIEQGSYTIIKENITTPVAGSNINDSSQYSSIVRKFGIAGAPKLIRHSDMIQDVGTGLINNMDTTNDPITDTIYGDEFFATISNSSNIPSSTEEINFGDDNNKLVQKSNISFQEVSYTSQAEDQEINVKKGIEPARFHLDNHNDIINNLSDGSRLNGVLRLKNSIDRTNVDEKLIVTESSVIIDDNSIQQMKQSVDYNESINMSTSEWNNLIKTPVNNSDLQFHNITNTSFEKQLNIRSDKQNARQKIDGGDALGEKTNHSDLSDNGLQETIAMNMTYPDMMIFVDTTTINGDLDKTSPMPYSDAQVYTTNANSIFPPINITKKSSEIPQQNYNYLSSTISSLTSLPHPFDISSSSSLLPIATTVEFDAVTPATMPSETGKKNFTTLTTSSMIIMNLSNNTSDTVKIDNSSARLLLVDQTTMSNVEYEFIGLNGSTYDNAEVEITSNFSNDMVKNDTLNGSSSDTSVGPNVEDSNMTTEFFNFDNANSIKNDIYLNTVVHTSSTDFDLRNNTTIIIDKIATSLSHTTEATSSSISIVDNRKSTTADRSEETTIADLTDITAITTSMVSTSAIYEYTIESETSSTIIGSTLTALENSTTVGILPITNDTTRSMTEDITMFVRMVIETSWSDVCPQLLTLRQAIANVLSAGIKKIVSASQVVFRKNPCTSGIQINSVMESWSGSVPSTLLLYIVDQDGEFDASLTRILPSLYRESPLKLQNASIHSFQLIENSDTNNAIAVIVISCIALICLVLLASLLFVMRKRQARFNYGERCRPVSLDAYSLDNISAFNSVRRKEAVRMSKRSYGNPAFEDSNAIPSHSLNSAGLAAFATQQNAIFAEFASISQVSVRIDELPNGAEIKNRYANVIPLPETRVSLTMIANDPLTEYINASYVRGPENVIKYYIGCQAPIDTTVIDFWRMIWEQQSKVIIMLTDFIENGVEKCAEYIPASEVTDCQRLYGNFQVTLKRRETKEKYAISTLHLKNLETNIFRELSHFWYLWPMDGIQMDAAGLIAVLLEARAVHRGDPGPIVVHCSPGTGRTGTLIALDLGIRQYEKSRTVDVPKIVYNIRRDRAGAVQTKEQYFFIYKALNLYATKLVSEGFEST